jgi:hypothetical protein
MEAGVILRADARPGVGDQNRQIDDQGHEHNEANQPAQLGFQ